MEYISGIHQMEDKMPDLYLCKAPNSVDCRKSELFFEHRMCKNYNVFANGFANGKVGFNGCDFARRLVEEEQSETPLPKRLSSDEWEEINRLLNYLKAKEK